VHSERIENRLLQEFCIPLASQALDDLAEHDVGVIAVFELFAWSEAQFLLAAEQLKHFRGGQFVCGGRAFGRSKIVFVQFHGQNVVVLRKPRSVIEQVADGDGAGVGGELRAKFGERIVKLEFVPLRENHNGHGRELLGERRQEKLRVGRDGRARVEIGKSENLAVLDASIADEHRGHSWRVFLFPVIQQLVKACSQRLRVNADAHKRKNDEASHRAPRGHETAPFEKDRPTKPIAV